MYFYWSLGALLIFCQWTMPSAGSAILNSQLLLEVENGAVLTATLSERGIPINGKFGALIIFGGFETGDKALGMIKTSEPVLLATIDYPYTPLKDKSTFRNIFEIYKVNRALRSLDLGIKKLVALLRKNPRVDSNKIAIAGVSFGAPFALRAGINNPHIHGVIIGHGFGRIDLAIERHLKWAWGEGTWNQFCAFFFSRLGWWAADYPAPEKLAKKFPTKKLLLINPENDDHVPKEGIEILTKRLIESKALLSIRSTPGGHIMPHRPEVLSSIVELSETWLKKQNLL